MENMDYNDYIALLQSVLKNYKKHTKLIEYCKDFNDFHKIFIEITEIYFDEKSQNETINNKIIIDLLDCIYCLILMEKNEN